MPPRGIAFRGKVFGIDVTVHLGKIGTWQRARDLNAGVAAEIEGLGYGAIWIGTSPAGHLRLAEELLDATSSIVIATGIVNMWSADAATVGASYHRITAKHPGRFLLGVGIGHPESTAEYQKPYDKIVSYLNELDEAGVPVADRALAALGPKVLKVSAERTAGAHPYLTTPEHTRQAREIVGAGKLLAPEQKAVVDADPVRARDTARRYIAPYLERVNYRSNLLRLGWTDDDLAAGGSDQLIDALGIHGDATTVAAGLTAHLDAGADHVCVQVLPPGDDALPGYRALADVVF